MAKATSAGDLLYSVAFDAPVDLRGDSPPTGDGAGGFLDGFSEQFTTRAAYIHLRGGETVMAARLQGKHTQVIRVRDFAAARAVMPDWRIRDTRTSTIFNIRDISPSADRRFIDFLCESGVAT